MISAIRFFAVAPLHSRYMLLALVVVLASGLVRLIVDPRRGADVLGPLALLQMLSASTGFAVTARRGHLDLLLTAGPSRLQIALTHLVVSVLPGLLVWALLGLGEMAAAGTLSPLAFTSGSVASLGLISGISWAMTVRLPRLSGGIAWLLGIAMWTVGWSGAPGAATLGERGAGALATAVLVVLCPFVLVGRALSPADILTILPAAIAGMGLVGAAVIWIVRGDVPLESAQ